MSQKGSKCEVPPLPTAAHARHTVNSAGQWNVTCVGSILCKTHGGLPRYTANSEHTSGAMERYMRGFDSAQNSRRPATIHRQQ
jgi:hypothetical protein